MAKTDVRTVTGDVVSTAELDDRIFGIERNDTLIHQAVLRIQANRRQGTADTKRRGEVHGTTAKMYRQKGTGKARHGAMSAPQFRHGGVVFGPHPRSYSQDMPKKMRRKALCSVLSDKYAEGKIHVIANIEMDVPHTKTMIATLAALNLTRRVCIVIDQPNPNLAKSIRNIQDVRTILAYTLNVVDAIDADHLVFTQEGLRALEGVLTSGAV